MTPDPQVEEPEDEMELEEDDSDEEELLIVTLRPDGKNAYYVKPDALEPGPWGILLADALHMIAWSLARTSGEESRRRQAEMLVQVKRRLHDELENPTSDLEVWTERTREES